MKRSDMKRAPPVLPMRGWLVMSPGFRQRLRTLPNLLSEEFPPSSAKRRFMLRSSFPCVNWRNVRTSRPFQRMALVKPPK